MDFNSMIPCPPAIVYLILILTRFFLNFTENIQVALVELCIGVIVCFLLNILCSYELTIVAWVIILIPILYTTFIVGMVFYMFAKSVANGKIPQQIQNSKQKDASANSFDNLWNIFDSSWNVTTVTSSSSSSSSKKSQSHYLFFSKYYDTGFS